MIIHRKDIIRYRAMLDSFFTHNVDEFNAIDDPEIMCNYNGLWLYYTAYFDDPDRKFLILFPLFRFRDAPLHIQHISEESAGKYLHITSERFKVCLDGKNGYSFRFDRYIFNKYVFGRYWKDEVEKANIKVIVEY